MRRAKFGFVLVIIAFVLESCMNSPTSQSATLGKSKSRNVVILGESIANPGVAKYYADKYNASAFYTTSRGPIADSVNRSIRNTFRTSSAMRHLINELRSINQTEGEWNLIIPSFVEKYFLLALRNMEAGDLANAKAIVRLVDSSKNGAIETEVNRISGGKVTVKYG